MPHGTNLYAAFIEGMLKGWKIATVSMLPHVVLSFVLIEALKVSGLLDILGRLFTPVMSLFDLPGESVTVLISTLFAAGSGIGAAAGLYANGILNSSHMTILMPGIFLMGALIQYMGRILGVAGVPSKHYPILLLIALLNAVLAMLTMKWLFV